MVFFPFHFNNIHDMTQIQINWNVPDCFKINVSFLVLFVSLHLKLKIVSDRLCITPCESYQSEKKLFLHETMMSSVL